MVSQVRCEGLVLCPITSLALDGPAPANGMLQKAFVTRVQHLNVKGAPTASFPIQAIRPIHAPTLKYFMGSIIQLLEDFLVVLILLIATKDSVIRVDLNVISKVRYIYAKQRNPRTTMLLICTHSSLEYITHWLPTDKYYKYKLK